MSPVELETDEAIVQFGPLSTDLVDSLNAGDVTMERYFRLFFRHKKVRRAFAMQQAPLCQRRAAAYTGAYFVYNLLVVSLRLATQTNGSEFNMVFLVNMPRWYLVMCLFYLFLCAACLCSLPYLARFRRLSWLASPRSCDMIVALCMGGWVAIVPRLYNGSDPFNLIELVQVNSEIFLNPSLSQYYPTLSLIFVVAGGGAFFSPLMALGMASFLYWSFATRFNEMRALITSDSDFDIIFLEAWPLAVASAILIFIHEQTTHAQFLIACKMQRMAARRIDQLHSEKERLDYERRMEGVRIDQMRACLEPQLDGSGTQEAAGCLLPTAAVTRQPEARLDPPSEPDPSSEVPSEPGPSSRGLRGIARPGWICGATSTTATSASCEEINDILRHSEVSKPPSQLNACAPAGTVPSCTPLVSAARERALWATLNAVPGLVRDDTSEPVEHSCGGDTDGDSELMLTF